MLKLLALAGALLCVLTINAEARQRHKTYAAHPDCNVTMPCEGVAPSVRGEHIAKRLGFGAAQKVYTHTFCIKNLVERNNRCEPPAAKSSEEINLRPNKHGHKSRVLASEEITHPVTAGRISGLSPSIVSHPSGCPARAFCGCGAAVRIFGAPIRSLWLAANWFKFPRTSPSPGAVAVRRHHVFVLEQHLGGDTWLAYDANSGRHQTRIHARSIAGYVIVNPRGGAA